MATISVQKMRRVDWRQGHQWSVSFPGEEAAFRKYENWLPAVEVAENIWGLEHFSFTVGASFYSIPFRGTPRTVQVTFIEDEDLTITNWMSEWVHRKILLSPGRVQYAHEASKMMVVQWKGFNGSTILENQYRVVPDGEGTLSGSSSSDVMTTSITFRIHSMLRRGFRAPSGTNGPVGP